MLKKPIVILFILVFPFFSFMRMDIFMPGEYSGWIVKDGFGTYFFYNGCHTMPLSKRIKNQFTAYENQPVSMKIDSITQFIQPGPAQIDSAKIIGAAEPDPRFNTDFLLSLSLKSAGDSGLVKISFTVKNTGVNERQIYPAQLTFIVTRKISRKDGDDFLWPGDDSSEVFYDSRWNYLFKAKNPDNAVEVSVLEMKTFYESEQVKSNSSYQESVQYHFPDGTYYIWGGYGDDNFSRSPSLKPSAGIKFNITNGRFVELKP